MIVTLKHLNINPMVKARARAFWESKQKLMQEFVEHLSVDLDMEEGEELIQNAEN